MTRQPSRFSVGLKGLSQAAGKPPEPLEASTTAAREPSAPTASEAAKQPPSRQGKVAISGYFDPAVRKQLAIMSVHQDKSQAALLAEALNLLFEKNGQPPIARA